MKIYPFPNHSDSLIREMSVNDFACHKIYCRGIVIVYRMYMRWIVLAFQKIHTDYYSVNLDRMGIAIYLY